MQLYFNDSKKVGRPKWSPRGIDSPSESHGFTQFILQRNKNKILS